MSAEPIDIAHDPERVVHYLVDPAPDRDRIDEGLLILSRIRETMDSAHGGYSGRRPDAPETHEWHCSDGTVLSIVPQVVSEGVQITIRAWLDGDVVTASMRGIGGPPSGPKGPPAGMWCLEIAPDALMTTARQSLDWMDACLEDVDRPHRVGSTAIDAILRGATWLALDELGGGDRFSVDVIAATPWNRASIWISPHKESIPHHDRMQEIVAPLNLLTPCLSMIVGAGNVSLGVHGLDMDPGDVDPIMRMRDVSAYREFVRRAEGNRR